MRPFRDAGTEKRRRGDTALAVDGVGSERAAAGREGAGDAACLFVTIVFGEVVTIQIADIYVVCRDGK